MRFPLSVDNSFNDECRQHSWQVNGWVDIRDADGQFVASFYMSDEATNLANAQAVVDAANRAMAEAA